MNDASEGFKIFHVVRQAFTQPGAVVNPVKLTRRIQPPPTLKQGHMKYRNTATPEKVGPPSA